MTDTTAAPMEERIDVLDRRMTSIEELLQELIRQNPPPPAAPAVH